MPGLSGLDAVQPIERGSPRTKVLMASPARRTEVRATGPGGRRRRLPEELALAIESIRRGDSYLPPRAASGVMARALRGDLPAPSERSALAALTPREVFQLLAVGKANKEVASLPFRG